MAKNTKQTSPKVATLGSKQLRSKSSSLSVRKVAGSVVSQARGKSKKR